MQLTYILYELNVVRRDIGVHQKYSPGFLKAGMVPHPKTANYHINSSICSYESFNIEYHVLNRKSKWDNELNLFISYEYKC